MFGRRDISTSRGRKWEWRHSLWILWTFALGFFSWLSFAYIGIRARHSRWTLWALFYAAPLILFVLVIPSQWWVDVSLNATLLLCPVSIVHAFLVRKEYLLRLDLIRRETSSVSITSRGRGWEWLHSLWMLWTLTLGLFSWVAFFYVAFRVRRVRWLLWGLAYFAAFAVFVVTANTQVNQVTVGIVIVAGIASVVHAFAIREDYLVRLERRLNEASEADAGTLHHPGEEGDRQSFGPSPVEELNLGMPNGSSSPTAEDATHKDGIAETSAETLPGGPPESPKQQPPEPRTEAPPGAPAQSVGETAPGARPKAPDEAPAGAPKGPRPRLRAGGDGGRTARPDPSSTPGGIADAYPLPLAYSWSLLRGLWDPRDRYMEQLRHAENMLAFLGSVSLAMLEKEDYERAQIDVKLPWQGGISFGGWKVLAQRSAKVFRTYQDHPLAAAIHKLKIGTETKGFGGDVAALISARNDFHHGRGPLMEEDFVDASYEAQERLERCMDALSFFARYPIRLIQDFDVDRRNGDFLLKCLRLEGDGPGFMQEKVSRPRALPRGELVMDLGDGRWAELYPFVVVSNCPHCRYRETYFIDRWDDRKGTVLMKSFERGHAEEKREISGVLAALAEGQAQN